VPEITLALNFFSFFSKELPNFSGIFAWHTHAEGAKKELAIYIKHI
jgi:hypothetical protein